jgi:hypothetical protein
MASPHSPNNQSQNPTRSFKAGSRMKCNWKDGFFFDNRESYAGGAILWQSNTPTTVIEEPPISRSFSQTFPVRSRVQCHCSQIRQPRQCYLWNPLAEIHGQDTICLREIIMLISHNTRTLLSKITRLGPRRIGTQ